MKTHYLKLIFTGIILFFLAQTALAGRGDKTKSIHTPSGGSPVVVGTSTAKDSIDLDLLSANQRDYNVLNRISFGVDIHYPEYVAGPQLVEISLNVKCWDVQLNALPDRNFRLRIAYYHQDTVKSRILDKFEFADAYKMVFQIDTIRVNGSITTTLPANLFVQGDIFTERYTELESGPVSNHYIQLLDTDCEGNDDGLRFEWKDVKGAEEYQVEFIYISNYGSGSTVIDPSQLRYDFRHNSTRITTANLHYDIPLVFDRGWVAYRVRAIGVDIDNPEHLIFGEWNNSDLGTIADLASSKKIEILDTYVHHGNLNWQYSANYAEQGKRSESIAYMDGTLRSRQQVTKSNAQNKVIVGETIYDHQGRPAINVLPVPIEDRDCGPQNGPSIKYYPEFNLNDSKIPYSKNDFDLSPSSEGDCSVSAAPMSTFNGASRYYSPTNSSQNMQQAYVPDAMQYPFQHIEYTPDQTGRISRQGGLGPDFQLGTGHETRFLYGNPNQLELNRLFGSEVGYSAHYQKNAVIDANGQVTVSYIDIEGRVVATALAGTAPKNLVTLKSSNEQKLQLEHILPDGTNQTVDELDNSITYSSSFLITSPTEFTMNYELFTSPMRDSCLQDICVDCVYELELSLKDDCGVNLLSDTLQHKTVGNFSRNPNGGYVFHAHCTTGSTFSPTTTVTLQIGKYTIAKKLTVVEEAVDAYLALIDSSECVLRYDDFLQAELQNVDSSICLIDCDNCLQQLGTLKEFVSNGHGTAAEFYARVEDCKQLCEDRVSDCSMYLTMMQLDMSPSGQYAEYLNSNGTLDLGKPLSILNTGNSLPIAAASWRNPVLVTPTGNQSIYVDAAGQRSKIYLSEDPNNPGTYLPAPLNSGMVQYDAATDQYFVYPEQLQTVVDFIDHFESSWALSLVKYHPEYCFYESCIGYEEKHSATDAFSSASFDELLYNTNTFAEAQALGFITGAGLPSNWFVPSGNNPMDSLKPWDPFVFYEEDFEANLCTGFGDKLRDKYNHFEYQFGDWYSMAEIAAYTVRCGSNFPSVPAVNCYNFGQLFNGVVDTNILNSEWRILKALYMSAKQGFQQDLARCKSILHCDAYNYCIGNTEYTPWPIFGYIQTSPSTQYYPFLDPGQPCSVFRSHLYRYKTKRFPNHEDAMAEDANSTAYELYLQTGQCPNAFALQHLLNELAQNSHLTAASYNLSSAAYLPALFQANNAYYNPGTSPALTYTATAGANTITANWNETASTLATLTLNKTASQNWNQVTGIVNLFATGQHTFTAEATYVNIANASIETFPISGSLSYFDLQGCTFEQECTSSQLALDLTTVFNVLNLDNALASTSPVDLVSYNSSAIGSVVNLTSLYIINAAHAGTSLSFVSQGNTYRIYNTSVPGNGGLYIKINNTVGNLSSPITGFGPIISTGTYSFEMKATQASGYPVTFEGILFQVHNGDTIGISAGNCDLPTPNQCEGHPFETFVDLQPLLRDVLKSYNGSSDIDLYASVFTTPAIVAALPFDQSETTSQDYGDSLVISAGDCDLILTMDTSGYKQFNNIQNLTGFKLVGDLNYQSAYTHFVALATFFTPAGNIQDTIYGTTCFSLKDCESCSGPVAGIANNTLIQVAVPIGSVSELESLIAALENNPEGSNPQETLPCPQKYDDYLNCLFNFNQSYTQFQLAQIPQDTFELHNYCQCVEGYCGLLSDILAGNLAFANQEHFNNYTSIGRFCGKDTINEPEDPCKLAYVDYLRCTSRFVEENTTSWTLSYIPRSAFDSLGLCNCVAAYCSALDAALAGLETFANQAEFDNYVFGKLNCTPVPPPPCTPTLLTGVIPEMPIVELENECISTQVNLAALNAQNAYAQYLDSINSLRRQKYLDHCLSTQERLMTSYNDREHHYMLYYYDLAGNLIKTVPPEGVELLPINSSSDNLNLQINGDRNDGIKTVFTSHRLQTRYEYNSLGQMVSTFTPDTDPMTAFEQTLPNGLNAKLVTKKIQMINAGLGYLAGSVDNRGYMYRTTDGGQTWKRVTNLVAADLKKIVMLDDNIGIAIGQAGTVLKTTDAGQNWDMVSTWNTAGMLEDLNDVAVLNPTSSPTIMVVGKNGLAANCTNFTASSPTFTMSNTGLSGDIVSIEASNGSFYCTAHHPVDELSKFYRFVSGAWTELPNVRTNNFSDVHFYGADAAYAADLEGRIYSNNAVAAPSSKWIHRSSNLADSILGIRFFNQQQGIALVQKNGLNKLFRTIDRAVNWTPLHDSSYHAVAISKNNAVAAAVGNNKRIAVIFPYASGTDQLVEVQAPSLAGNCTAVWVEETNGNVRLIVSDNSRIFYTQNALLQHPVWIEHNYSSIGTPIVKLDADLMPSGEIFGVAITASGQAWRLKRDLTSEVQLVTTAMSGSGYAGLSKGDHYFYLTFANSGGMRYVSKNATTTVSVLAGISYNAPFISAKSQRLVAASNTGDIGFVQLNSAGTTNVSSSVHTQKVYPDQINRLKKDVVSDKIFAFGNDGLVYHWDASVNSFRRITNYENNAIYDAHVNNAQVVIVGANGLAKKGTHTSYATLQMNAILTSSGQTVAQAIPQTDLYGVNITAGNRFYAVGQNGALIYSPNFTVTAPTYLSQGNTDLFGVALKNNAENVLIIGEHALLQEQFGAMPIVNSNLFVPPVLDFHFADAVLATVISENYVARSTDNGTATWKIVKPLGNQNPTATYAKVWTTSTGKSLLFGNANSLLHQMGSGSTTTAFPSSDVTAVSLGTNNQTIYLVDAGVVKRINLSSLAPTTLHSLSGSNTAHALKVFSNGDHIVVGSAGLYQHYNAAGTLLAYAHGLPAEDLNDLAFTDHLNGVIVGNGGTYYKAVNPTVSPTGFLQATQWQQVDLTATDPVGASPGTIHAVAYVSPVKILIGGKNASSSASNAYVRHIYDAGGRYSTRFFYDRLGRLVVSQNSRQEKQKRYSYVLYDALGRVYESGEKTENAGGTELRFKGIFGTEISGYFNPSAIDDTHLESWITASGDRSEVVRSYYDQTTITGLPGSLASDLTKQRLRIAHVTFEELYDGNDQTFDHATHYSYDIHGNVKTLVQDNQKMAVSFPSIATGRFKTVDYSYDLLSGNVHRVSIQSGQPDQWHHAYTYDADNRLRKVYTNTSQPLTKIGRLTQNKENELAVNSDWQNDAQYYFYDHGPLARMEVGQNNLQGVDYHYNLQGWIIGANSSVLDAAHDPGKDSGPGLNALFAKDIFGFGLNYYTGDYTTISGATPRASVANGSHPDDNSRDLYNGNIRYMQTAITNPLDRSAMPMVNAYRYDQLQRLSESRSYEAGLSSNEWNPKTYNDEYHNTFTYDGSGNILTQNRHRRDGTQIENLKYNYQRNSNDQVIRNRLYHVNDDISSGLDSTDIDDMGAFDAAANTINSNNNYVYDAQGRLVKDRQEEIDTIIWTATNKIKEIRRTASSQKMNLEFDYDALGQRIAKHVYENQTLSLVRSSYYVISADKNTVLVYEHEIKPQAPRNAVFFRLAERNIYGEKRMGTVNDTVNMVLPNLLPSYGLLGNRSYEFSNHLGNVLMVSSDILYPISSGGSSIDGYEVGINQATDYSPFGVQLDGRTISNPFADQHRYGFQGQEKDNEIKSEGNSLNYEYRMHDPRIGRFFATDPLEEDYPWNTPYAFSENRLLDGVELEGLEWSRVNEKGDEVWFISDLISESLDYIPGVGTLKGVLEAWDGERAFTGDPLNTWERGIGMIPYVSKVPIVKKTLKAATKVEKAVELEQKVEKKVTTAVKKSVSSSNGKKAATAPVGSKKITSTTNSGATANKTLTPPGKGKGSVAPKDRDPKRVYTKKQRQDLLDEQDGKCLSCGDKKTVDEVDGHHIKRHADGGQTTKANGAALCKDCHKKIHK
ncbi:RHS repeat-associated core domain-containing protein [Pedobacter xixiisoli]|uniref:RHS repeat-associated core domain-containing protein n=1 Tax=Pedobacter xixiisoli TaxID=1476464 RepID=A0A286A787_9SPHI|nr:RHS repeat-associated core domain-containing protein [Pedobacter xixiisoli]SOD17745.1 RHS repeat-associated core domain-containing protein [Pedobacter xixiisoli]